MVCIFQRIGGRKITTKIQRKTRTPGPVWISLYMKRNNLSLKEATKLSIARYNATKNPFSI